MVRALELNTDIGYIPEKSNKTGNGIEIFFLQKIPVGKSYTKTSFKPHKVDTNLRPAYFPKKEYLDFDISRNNISQHTQNFLI